MVKSEGKLQCMMNNFHLRQQRTSMIMAHVSPIVKYDRMCNQIQFLFNISYIPLSFDGQRHKFSHFLLWL